MQLRVTRLCLDCEELFVGSTCPVCASERCAFLTTWLPVEERRRWRRSAPKDGRAAGGYLRTLKRLIARWLGDDDSLVTERRLRTRASDVLPKLEFDEPAREVQSPHAPAREFVRDDG
jgi:hypothetical protein